MARGSSLQSPGQRVFMIFLIFYIVSLFNCMILLSCPPALCDIFYTFMARYSLFCAESADKHQLTNFDFQQPCVATFMLM